MKANEFIKKFGLDYAKERLAYCKGARLVGMEIDLKRLVESHELVFEHGSIERAKLYAESKYTAPEVSERLFQAISDVESCQ